MRRKIIHLQNEIHRKAIAFFTHEFDAIIIPPFEVSGMTSRKTRKISQKTVKKMLGWAHYRFCQRLQKSLEFILLSKMKPIPLKLVAGVEKFKKLEGLRCIIAEIVEM